MVYSTDRSKAVVPVLVLLFVALWFILRGDFSAGIALLFCSCVFSVLLALRLPRLGKREEERVSLCAVCTFVRFAHVWFCMFPLPLNVWEGLRFVIVALPGLFSYPFFFFIVYEQLVSGVAYSRVYGLMAMLHSLIARRRFEPQTQ